MRIRNFFWPLFGTVAVIIGITLRTATPLPIQTESITVSPVASLGHGPVLLVPLDSRPPCNQLVQKLAAIAGIEIIVPPNRHLDNYKSPANREAVRQWTYNQLSYAQGAVLSSDLFMYGGLIASRHQQTISKDEVLKTSSFLQQLHAKHAAKPIYLFSIIPRLLIAEDDETKLWQEPMRQWATAKDIYDTFEQPADFKKLETIRRMLPDEVINQYEALYQENAARNHLLLSLASKGVLSYLVLGQDDAQPFGLPNRNRNLFRDIISQNKLSDSAATTRGADEIAMLLLARWYNERTGFTPKIFIEYSDRSVPEMIMPFMSASTAESAAEKAALVGGVTVSTPEEADFILFVHCGNSAISARKLNLAAQKVNQYLSNGYAVALVDLSQEYKAHQTLLPSLLANQAPLVQLTAYAGWNTTSNSLGTAISQASLFKARLRLSQSPQEELSIYSQNLSFTLERLLDDWAYQKKVQKEIDATLIKKGQNPYRLGNARIETLSTIERKLQQESQTLLQKNLRRHPFYQQKSPSLPQNYYLQDILLDCRLPWDRTFEIDLTVHPVIGLQVLSQ